MSEHIPVVDVTESEQTRDEVMAQARVRVVEMLDQGHDYVLVQGSEQNVNVVAACDDTTIFRAALALATMIGANAVGKGLENMPPAIAQVVALTSGLKELNEFARRTMGSPEDTKH